MSIEGNLKHKVVWKKLLGHIFSTVLKGVSNHKC